MGAFGYDNLFLTPCSPSIGHVIVLIIDQVPVMMRFESEFNMSRLVTGRRSGS